MDLQDDDHGHSTPGTESESKEPHDPLPAFATASMTEQRHPDTVAQNLRLFNTYIIHLINTRAFPTALLCPSISQKFLASTAHGWKDRQTFWEMHKAISEQYPTYHIVLINERCEVDVQEGKANLVCDCESKGRPEGVVYTLVVILEFEREGKGKIGRWVWINCSVIAGSGGVA